jgi:hypothetical protein
VHARHSDRYFLESGDKIRCFLVEESFGENGKPAPGEETFNQ